jgi:hypothetical protein
MKFRLPALFALFFAVDAHADPSKNCVAAVDNLVRWSNTDLTRKEKQAQVNDCKKEVETGAVDAIIAAECLSNPDMETAVQCMSDGIIQASLSQCDTPMEGSSAEECRAQITAMSSQLPEQLKSMIISGQVLEDHTPEASTIQLPPPPTEPGSCAQMIENVNAWSKKTQTAEELTEAVKRCKAQKSSGSSDTRIVIMCLSLPEVDAASDCLVHEAVRANLADCKGTPEETALCEQMLVEMIEPLKKDFRSSILDGSLLE